MRSLSRDARHERRVQVIRLRETGLTYDAIAVQTGLSRTGVFGICHRHAAGGAKALRGAVAELIADRFGIRVPVRTMGTYLKRWGFTPQKPIRRAYEQSPTAVKHWLETDYPAIAARATKEGAEIHRGDETGLRGSSGFLRVAASSNIYIKQEVTKQAPARTKLQLVKAASRHLRIVQKQPERVRRHFQHIPVRYAS